MSGRGFPQENNTGQTTPEPTIATGSAGAVAQLRLAAVAVGLVFAVIACEPYEPEPRVQSFILPGPHAALECASCHLDEPPYDPIIWDINCISCHTAAGERQELGKADYATWGPAHYPGYANTTCSNNGGCHLDTHESWGVAAAECGGGVDHSFFPLEGLHALDCATCHSSPDCNQFSAVDVVDPVGAPLALSGRTLCMSCHEADRPEAHYLELDNPVRPPDADKRWDCKACHDPVSRDGAPVTQDWVFTDNFHGKNANTGIRVPHGTFGGIGLGYGSDDVAIPPEQWVTECVACHPAGEPVAPNPAYQCTVACHQELFELNGIHQGNAPGADATCIYCHINGEDRYE